MYARCAGLARDCPEAFLHRLSIAQSATTLGWTSADLCELSDQRGSGKRFSLGRLFEFLQAGTMPDPEAVGAQGVQSELVIMDPKPRERPNIGLDFIECRSSVARHSFW
jgi:hypothetical protein